MEKPFYISQLPEKTQAWIKEKTKENFLKDGMSEGEAEQKATDFLDEKVNVAEDFFGKDFYKSLNPAEDKLDHEVVNDFAIDAIKDNFTPPGAKDKNIGKRFKTKLGNGYSIEEEISPTDYRVKYDDGKFDLLSKDLHNKNIEQGFAEQLKDEIDTNDNGKIEKDEMEKRKDDDDLEVENLKEKYVNSKPSREENVPGENYKRYPSLIKKKADDELDEYLKDLDKYLSKNPKGRDDIPVTTRR